MSSDNTNIIMILIDATIPNSRSSVLLVSINVAKPQAVVMLVISVAFPIFEMTRCNDRAWLPCFLISFWYLLIRKIQFGTPITMIIGGISAVRTVISYPNNPIIPNAHITPITTMDMEMKVARYDLKKKKKISVVTSVAATTNKPISSKIILAFMVRIYGIPDTRTSSPVSFSNAPIFGISTLSTKACRSPLFTTSGRKYTPACTTPVSLLKSNSLYSGCC